MASVGYIGTYDSKSDRLLGGLGGGLVEGAEGVAEVADGVGRAFVDTFAAVDAFLGIDGREEFVNHRRIHGADLQTFHATDAADGAGRLTTRTAHSQGGGMGLPWFVDPLPRGGRRTS